MQWYSVVRDGSLYDRYVALSPSGGWLAGGAALADVLSAIERHGLENGSRHTKIRYLANGDRCWLSPDRAARIHAADSRGAA